MLHFPGAACSLSKRITEYGTPVDFTAFHFEFNRKLKVRQQCSSGVVGLYLKRFVLLHELLQRNIAAPQWSAQLRAFLEHLGVCDLQYSSKYFTLRNGGRLLNVGGNESGVEAGLQNKTIYQRHEYHGSTYASRSWLRQSKTDKSYVALFQNNVFHFARISFFLYDKSKEAFVVVKMFRVENMFEQLSDDFVSRITPQFSHLIVNYPSSLRFFKRIVAEDKNCSVLPVDCVFGQFCYIRIAEQCFAIDLSWKSSHQ
ncbi:unnamed protein product [Gongylonema pulchrum]|uniref:PIPK domain-containing protein n=1 Tax=Gongylonema pulchrum TaxID=637853 RepID=A0A183EK40_9BILA|nr:unnamed protein product [Gongylonema pulchrum]